MDNWFYNTQHTVLNSIAIEYQPCCLQRFAELLTLPWPILLHSDACSACGRYDFFSAAPLLTVNSTYRQTVIRRTVDGKQTCTPHDAKQQPFSIAKTLLQALSVENDSQQPFATGFMGYWSYDLTTTLYPVALQANPLFSLPLMSLGFYDWFVVLDHKEKSAYFCYIDLETSRTAVIIDDFLPRLTAATPLPSNTAFRLTSDINSNLSKEEYAAQLALIRRHLLAGDCYQVNFAQRFSACYQGDLLTLYQQLRSQNPTPFAGFFRNEAATVLSLSPERFLQVDKYGKVQTKPIKGTCRRGNTATEDQQLARQLQQSEKDRAENVMIVDLLRNDLGRCCHPGSIVVTQLLALETYANVHHLVSTIEGQLSRGQHAIDCLAACFPGGSITGAPKLSAMQIIAALEPQRRSIYCGCLGYISCDGAADTNICIRTLLATDGKLHFWAGGGIVIDSQTESEYAETFAKVSGITALLNSYRQ